MNAEVSGTTTSPADAGRLRPRVLFAVLLLAAAALSVTTGWDEMGREQTDEAFVRSLSSFAIARGLNATISFFQGTELKVPAVTLAVGEILDPLNDLIERFSWLMLASSVSLAIQKLLLEAGAETAFGWAMAGGLVLCALVFVAARGPALRRSVTRLALILVVLRFAAPLAVFASSAVFDVLLADAHDQAVEELQASSAKLGEVKERILRGEELATAPDRGPAVGALPPALAADDGHEPGVWVSVKRQFGLIREQGGAVVEAARSVGTRVTGAFDVERRLEQGRQAIAEIETVVAETSESTARLAAVFVVQSILLPLLTLVLVYWALKGCLWAKFAWVERM
jgi:hypothetical protein